MKRALETRYNTEKDFENHGNVKPTVSYEQKEYKLLPLFQDQFAHLNNILSLHSNDYLACRWNSFLDNVPENYIRIGLYMDYKNSLEAGVVRRKVLNGKFYGINNKLAPVPQFNDPRSMEKKTLVRKISST